MRRKFAKCATKNGNHCTSHLPSIATFALHFSDINNGDSESMELIFNKVHLLPRFSDRIEDEILGAVT
jgi:hypothetical protein